MNERCGFQTKTTDQPCTHPVGPGTVHCAAGHPVDPRRWTSSRSEGQHARIQPGAPFDFEDLVDSPTVGPDDIRLPHPSFETVPVDPPATVTEIDVARWARAGATNPDVVKALREWGVTAEEGARRVTISTSESVTLVTAVERGEIAAYDAPMVATTWPGEGWTYEGDQFRWTTKVSAEYLAQLARESDPSAAALRMDDLTLGAQMAAELAQCSSQFDGADLVIFRGTAQPPAGWREGLDDGLFSMAAAKAAAGLAAGDSTFVAFRRRWLETPTPGPASVAI